MCEFYNNDDLRRIEKNSIHDLLILIYKLRQELAEVAEERDELQRIIDNCSNILNDDNEIDTVTHNHDDSAGFTYPAYIDNLY